MNRTILLLVLLSIFTLTTTVLGNCNVQFSNTEYNGNILLSNRGCYDHEMTNLCNYVKNETNKYIDEFVRFAIKSQLNSTEIYTNQNARDIRSLINLLQKEFPEPMCDIDSFTRTLNRTVGVSINDGFFESKCYSVPLYNECLAAKNNAFFKNIGKHIYRNLPRDFAKKMVTFKTKLEIDCKEPESRSVFGWIANKLSFYLTR